MNVLAYSINQQNELCYAIKQILVNSNDDEAPFTQNTGRIAFIPTLLSVISAFRVGVGLEL